MLPENETRISKSRIVYILPSISMYFMQVVSITCILGIIFFFFLPPAAFESLRVVSFLLK